MARSVTARGPSIRTLRYVGANWALAACVVVSVAHAKPTPVFNGGFEATSAGKPDGWTPYGWSGVNPGEVAVASDTKTFGEGKHGVSIGATAKGASGLISKPVPLPKGTTPIGVSVKFKPSADFTGNEPWTFISWQDASGNFISTTAIDGRSTQPGGWTLAAVRVPRDKIPAGTAALTINVTVNRGAKSEPVAGRLVYDDARCDFGTEAAPSAAAGASAATEYKKPWLASAAFASWYALGDTVTYKVADPQTVPAGLRTLTGTVYDSADRVVATVPVDAAKLAREGWTYKPARPGLYEVAFAYAAAGPATRPVEQPLRFGPKESPTVVGVARWTFAVAAIPVRPMADRQAQFGMSVGYSGGRDARLADVLGMSFVRFQASGWGANFGDLSAAVEPERGVFKWDRLDKEMAVIDKLGLETIGQFLYTPKWASPHPELDKLNICIYPFAAYAPKDMNDFRTYVREVVRRYGKKVKTWEMWNEPNIKGSSVFWEDTPEKYVELLKAGYETVKQEQPESTVLFGGMGPRASYVVFYDKALKAGAWPYFDALALHGAFASPEPFNAVEKRNGQSSPRPWTNTEWHAALFSSNEYEGTFPAPATFAKKLMLDLMQQVKNNVVRVAVFEATNLGEAEMLPTMKAEGRSAHVSGLFRAQPSIEPRLIGVVLRTLIDHTKDRLTYRGAFSLANDQFAAWFETGGKPLVIVWTDAKTAAPLDAKLAAALTPAASAFTWENAPVDTESLTVTPQSMLLIEGMDAAKLAALPNDDDVVTARRKTRRTDVQVVEGTFRDGTLFADVNAAPSAGIPWQDKAWKYVAMARPQSAGFSARYAVAVSGQTLDLAVEVTDRTPTPSPQPTRLWEGDSVQFSLDTNNSGLPEGQVEFVTALNGGKPTLVKILAPRIGGDIPARYTPVGKPVQNAAVRIDRAGDKTVYKIRVDTSELFPFAYDAGQPLRLSVLVNDNDGRGRAGYLEWGSGIGGLKDANLFGRLTPAR